MIRVFGFGTIRRRFYTLVLLAVENQRINVNYKSLIFVGQYQSMDENHTIRNEELRC